MEIRNANRNDSVQIGLLHAESWRTAYSNVLSEEYLSEDIVTDRVAFWSNRLEMPAAGLRVIVAEQNHQLLGFACFVLDNDPEWGTLLDNLHVPPALKRIGIGTLLMAEVGRICLEQANHHGLYLWVLEPNANAQKFYKTLGASHAGSDVWHPPGGGQVPKFRFAWQNLHKFNFQGPISQKQDLSSCPSKPSGVEVQYNLTDCEA